MADSTIDGRLDAAYSQAALDTAVNELTNISFSMFARKSSGTVYYKAVISFVGDEGSYSDYGIAVTRNSTNTSLGTVTAPYSGGRFFRFEVIGTAVKVYQSTNGTSWTQRASYTDANVTLAGDWYTDPAGHETAFVDLNAADPPPYSVVGVWQVDATHTGVVFDKNVGTLAAGGFSISDGVTVSGAACIGNLVILTHSALAWNSGHVLTVDAATTGGSAASKQYYATWIADGDEQQSTHPFANQACLRGGFLFFCWLGADYKPRACRYNIATGVFSAIWVSASAVTAADRHQFPSIFVDQNGKVVIVYCPRWTGVTAYAGRVCIAASNYDSATPFDMGAWANISTATNSGLTNPKFSYFNPVMYADGTVIAFLRDDTDWSGWYWKKTPAQTWQQGTLTKYATPASGWTYVYPGRPFLKDMGEGVERLVIPTTIATNTPTFLGTMVLYTDDKGGTFLKADGTAVSLPLDCSVRTDSVLWPMNDFISGSSSTDAGITANGDLFLAVEHAEDPAGGTSDYGFEVFRFPAGGTAWQSVVLNAHDGSHLFNAWSWGAAPKFASGAGSNQITCVGARETGVDDETKSTHLTVDVFYTEDWPVYETDVLPQAESDGGYWRDYFPQVVVDGQTAYVLWQRGYLSKGGSLHMTTFYVDAVVELPESSGSLAARLIRGVF